jgi:hypothetical protein
MDLDKSPAEVIRAVLLLRCSRVCRQTGSLRSQGHFYELIRQGCRLLLIARQPPFLALLLL